MRLGHQLLEFRFADAPSHAATHFGLTAVDELYAHWITLGIVRSATEPGVLSRGMNYITISYAWNGQDEETGAVAGLTSGGVKLVKGPMPGT